MAEPAPPAAGYTDMYCGYILKNEQGRHYIGYTHDIETRLRKHNSNSTRSTKNRGPWKVIKVEKFLTKEEAIRREQQIKKYKGGEAFKKLIGML